MAPKATKRKPEAGPEAPKRPQSGYGQYISEKREEISATLIKEGVEKAKVMTLTATRGGAMWKALTEAQQKPYNDKSARLMEEYMKTLEDFKSANPDYKKVKKQKRGEDKPPTRPGGAYALWMADNKVMLTEMVMKNHGVEKNKAFFMLYKEGKPIFEALPAKDKEKYEEQKTKAMEVFHAEQKEWKERQPAKEGSAKEQKAAKAEGKAAKAASGEPKRPLGAYQQYLQDNRKTITEQIMKDKGVKAGEAFLMLYKEGKPIYDKIPAAERKLCEDNAAAAKEKFAAERKEWKQKQASGGA